MANLTFIEENALLNAPSINLLNEFSMFNEVFTWNVVSGTATALNVDSLQLQGDRCLRITPNFSVDTVVNSGGSENLVTVVDDGNYIFSIKHQPQYSSTGAVTEIALKVYINAVETEYLFYGDNLNNDEYKTYYQVIPLVAGDTVDFAFGFGSSDIGGTRKNYFDAFKLELDSYGLGIPTVFSPTPAKVLDLVETIDVPSISSGASYVASVTFTGAEVGDNVELVAYPNELIDMELIVCKPIVYSADLIKFVIHNPSGGAHNPASGDYTFKIVK